MRSAQDLDRQYMLYKACEEHFSHDKSIVDAVLGVVINILKSIQENKGNLKRERSDEEKKQRWIAFVNKVSNMLDRVDGEENTYFGVQVRQLKKLFRILFGNNNRKYTTFMGIPIKTLSFNEIVVMVGILQRMHQVKFQKEERQNKINEESSIKTTPEKKKLIYIDDRNLEIYLISEESSVREKASLRIIELYQNDTRKKNKQLLERAKTVMKDLGE